MGSRNVNDKRKLPPAKPINRTVVPKLPVSKIVKPLQNTTNPPTKTPVPSTSNRNPVNPGKSSTLNPTKAKPEKSNKLPCLDYEHVLKILRLAKVETFGFKQLIRIRSLGKAWRLAVDNVYLPYCYKPASLWSPYISNRVPEDALARSTAKHFKFPQDFQLFQEMCTHPHNPFPTRELKIWCQGELSPSDFGPSVSLIGNHLWSLTYVVGPSLNSIRLLFDLLRNMPELKDLRVIEAYPEAMDDESEEETIIIPHLDIFVVPSLLTCLSVTGSDNPSILLDNLLNTYGKGSNLKCLELQGQAAVNSVFLQQETHSNIFLSDVQKLKICGADPQSLETVLNEFGWGYYLTHLSIDVHRDEGSPLISNALVDLFDMVYQLTELHLYFDNMDGIPGMELDDNGVRLGPPTIRLYSLDTIRKLGLPYLFAQWNCWSLYNCPSLEEIEFHEWGESVDDKLRDANSVKFGKVAISEIRSQVSRYRAMYRLQKVIVDFGKSGQHSLVFQREDLLGRNYRSYDW